MAALPDGLLVLDKPAGPTSHDCVGRARRWFGTRKIGHAGTLDPFATGVLVLALGRATRLLEYVSGTTKAYHGTVALGQSTATDDREGELLAEADAAALTAEQVAAALAEFRGAIAQVPPMASAKKIDGQRLHKLHRQGQVIERPPVTVQIDTLELVGFTPGRLATAEIEVVCGPGTYIRALARDLGARLGVGGHLTALRRTRVGAYALAEAVTWPALEAMTLAERLAHLSPPARAVAHLPGLTVSETDRPDLACGKPLLADLPDEAPVAAFDAAGELLAIGAITAGWFTPRKVFCAPPPAAPGAGEA